MGLFDFLKKDRDSQPDIPAANTGNIPTAQTVSEPPVFTQENGTQIKLLNLEKGDILDLRKYSEMLKTVRVSAGWKINKLKDRAKGNRYDYDLDLCAYLCSDTGLVDTVYYGDKKSKGIFLDGDDLTGSDDGNDNENIFVELDKIPANISKIYFAVVIYQAKSRNQSFGNVEDAYIRLVDTGSRNAEICRYSMSDNGGENTAITAAMLSRGNAGWSFAAIGTYSKDSIETLGRTMSLNRR